MSRKKKGTPEINDIQRERFNKARENYKRIKKSLEPFADKRNIEHYRFSSEWCDSHCIDLFASTNRASMGNIDL